MLADGKTIYSAMQTLPYQPSVLRYHVDPVIPTPLYLPPHPQKYYPPVQTCTIHPFTLSLTCSLSYIHPAIHQCPTHLSVHLLSHP